MVTLDYQRAEVNRRMVSREITISQAVREVGALYSVTPPRYIEEIKPNHAKGSTGPAQRRTHVYLTDGQKERIRREYESGEWSMRGLGDKYGVSSMTVFRVINGKKEAS